jgi:hypothetical protein
MEPEPPTRRILLSYRKHLRERISALAAGGLMNHALRSMVVATSLACVLLAGCHVTENDHGDKKDVDIGTPFGSMKVDTGKTADLAAIGITAYPGATPVQDKGDDSNNANINMSFGSFHLGVKAADFQTSDPTDKVLAFYRKDLGSRYGGAIECSGHNAVGSPARTSQGLTCNDNEGTHIKTGDGHSKGFSITTGDSSSHLELRAGSPQHLHIVSVEDHDGGTKIGLVVLDLPSHLSDHDSKDSE